FSLLAVRKMLPRCVCLGIAFFAVACFNLRAGTLDDAIALLNGGQPEQAKQLIATIGQDQPDYGAAQCYNALCLYALGDYRGFLKQLDSAAVKQATIGADVREDLAFKQIDALFRYRRFEDLLPRLRAFQQAYPTSPRIRPLKEYWM